MEVYSSMGGMRGYYSFIRLQLQFTMQYSSMLVIHFLGRNMDLIKKSSLYFNSRTVIGPEGANGQGFCLPFLWIEKEGSEGFLNSD